VIVAIGDSHAATYEGIADLIIPQQFTIYNVVKGELDLTFASHEIHNPYSDTGKTIPITSDMTIIFIFGEIDCRMYLVGREHTILKLCQDYISKLNSYRVNYIVASITPPTDAPVPEVYQPIAWYTGTLDQRIWVTKFMNLELKRACVESKTKFLDIYDHYALANGKLNPEISDGWTHILPAHNDYIKKCIGDILK